MALPALSLSPALRKNRFLKTLIVGIYNWLLGQKGRGTIYLCIIKFYISVFSASRLTYSFSGFSFCFSFLFITTLYEYLHTLIMMNHVPGGLLSFALSSSFLSYPHLFSSLYYVESWDRVFIPPGEEDFGPRTWTFHVKILSAYLEMKLRTFLVF